VHFLAAILTLKEPKFDENINEMKMLGYRLHIIDDVLHQKLWGFT
jgi:hypothetical protein